MKAKDTSVGSKQRQEFPGICKEGELGLGQNLASLLLLVQEGAAASLVTGTGASRSMEVSGPVSQTWMRVFASVGGKRSERVMECSG